MNENWLLPRILEGEAANIKYSENSVPKDGSVVEVPLHMDQWIFLPVATGKC